MSTLSSSFSSVLAKRRSAQDNHVLVVTLPNIIFTDFNFFQLQTQQ